MINPISNIKQEVVVMTNLAKALILNAFLAVLLAGGFVCVNNVQAESSQPELITSLDADFDVFTDSGIEVAQNSCGSETCTSDQCCFLNIENGNQCCRPKKSNNCVESCKNSKAC